MAQFRRVVCQKTGDFCSPEDLIKDGYTGLMVARWNYDPPKNDVVTKHFKPLLKQNDYTDSYIQDVVRFPTLDLTTFQQYTGFHIFVGSDGATISG